MKRSDIKIGESYAFTHSPNRRDSATWKFTVTDVKQDMVLKRGTYSGRRKAVLFVGTLERTDLRVETDFKTESRYLISTWDEYVARRDAAQRARQDQADRQAAVEAAHRPQVEALVARLAAIGSTLQPWDINKAVRQGRVELPLADLVKLLDL